MAQRAGVSGVGKTAAQLGNRAETACELACCLYAVCERKKQAAEALQYHALVQSRPEIARVAPEGGAAQTEQAALFGDEGRQ